jgi:hypothetical protein
MSDHLEFEVEQEYDAKLTGEQIRILLSITGPRIQDPAAEKYDDWSIDLDRRLKKAEPTR